MLKAESATKAIRSVTPTTERSARGIGGMGSFSLSNRQLITGKTGHEPSYTENKEGKIVIDIIVDTKGNVIRADIGRGTTIEDVGMRGKGESGRTQKPIQ